MNKKLTFSWLLLGLGSQLQVVFSLSISEVLVLLAAPFLLMSEIPYMRKHGVMPFFNMTVLLFIGCIASLIVNNAEYYQVIRGVAITVILICTVVVGHYMIRVNPCGLKWYFIGVMLSNFVCIFVFQRSVEVTMAHGTDVSSIMSGPLFWIQRLGSVMITPIQAFYLKIPLAYSVLAPLFLAFFSILTTESGRSASLSFFAAATIVMLGRKKQRFMMIFERYFLVLFFIAIVCVFAIKTGYEWAALNDFLGEKARTKYEQQTAGGTGIVKLLIGGRADSFVGLLAAVDSPFLGKGYWASDTEGYYEEFLAKYGSSEDYKTYIETMQYYARKGIAVNKMISCHSHITSFWVWYGLPGLLFWLYVIYVVYKFLRNDVHVVPQWFYWLVAGVPGFIWHVLFSPFNNRIGVPLYVIAMLMARAVRMGRYQLPFEMIREIEETERR